MLQAQVFSCEFCEISRNTFFLQNTSGRLLAIRLRQIATELQYFYKDIGYLRNCNLR